ncbi:MAG: carboxypeptidase-like regulatory domain-containing protein [Sphingobacteriales bacterium]|nr:carboxypeptidase-like regulatory domain-containing protein [Sphingobacteriales bacterium]
MRKTILSIFFLIVSCYAFGQFELRGIVIDAKSKEPMPYVNYSVGSSMGGTTDDSGRFSFMVNAKTDSVIFSYLGYKNESLKKRFFKKDSIVVKMHLESFMLEEFTVKAKRNRIPKDTVAIRIFRNVVRHKDENKPKSYDTYSYEEYLKTVASLYNISSKITTKKIFKPFRFILENQDSTSDGTKFVPLILKETLTDHYFNKDPKKNKNVLKATKISGIEQLRFSELLDVIFDDIEIYGNQAQLNGKTFLLPFADGGLALYNYYLIDSTKGADSVWLYNLAFVPKSKSDLLFNGKATIRDSSFAIQKIELGIDKRSNVNFINDFHLKQGFENTGKGWFKNEEERSTDVGITKRKKAKTVRIARYLHRKNIIVDEPIADSILGQPDAFTMKDHRKKTDSFWVAQRHDSLSQPEAKVYFLIDSLKSTKFYKVISRVGSFFVSGYYKTKTLDYGSLYQFVSLNELEKVRIRVNIKNNWRLNKWVNFKVYGAYGIKDKRFKYGVEFAYFLPDKKSINHTIGASFKDDYQRLSVNGTNMDFDYIYTSALRTRAISDLVYLKDAKLYYYREWRPDISTNLSLNLKMYQTLPGSVEFVKTSEWGIKDTIRTFKIFAPNINFTATPGAKFLQTERQKLFLKGNLPRIYLDFSFSFKKLGSDFNYQKIDLLIEERLPSPIGYTKIQLNASKIFGMAPYPLLTIHPGGNKAFLLDAKRFQNMDDLEYVADQSLTLFIEHHFDGFFFNKIPGWRKLGLREIFTTKMALSSYNKKAGTFSDLPAGVTGLNGFYAEMGFGIENILKLVRVDFSWRLTQLDKPGITKFRWTLSFYPRF